MDKIDREYLALILHANNPSRSETNPDEKDDDTEEGDVGPPIPTQTEEPKEETGIDLPEIIEQIKTTRKGNRAYDCQVVLNYFKFILKKWSQELNERELDEKKTVQGKIETALHSQTCAYMKPLFRKLKTNTLQDDILESLINVVNCVLKRNYIRANEFFLEMAIGNAPW
jgi:pre-mRNA-splicing factor 18